MITERTKKGQAISPAGRTATAKKKLRRFTDAAKQRGDLEAWRRGRAVLGYIDGRRVIEMAAELDVTRGAINRWLQWYEADGVEGLVTGKPPGAAPRLSDFQRDLLYARVSRARALAEGLDEARILAVLVMLCDTAPAPRVVFHREIRLWVPPLQGEMVVDGLLRAQRLRGARGAEREEGSLASRLLRTLAGEWRALWHDLAARARAGARRLEVNTGRLQRALRACTRECTQSVPALEFRSAMQLYDRTIARVQAGRRAAQRLVALELAGDWSRGGRLALPSAILHPQLMRSVRAKLRMAPPVVHTLLPLADDAAQTWLAARAGAELAAGLLLRELVVPSSHERAAVLREVADDDEQADPVAEAPPVRGWEWLREAVRALAAAQGRDLGPARWRVWWALREAIGLPTPATLTLQ